MHGQRPMHGSRTSAHEQGAAAQSRHSKRHHTVPGRSHGSRASSVPTQALGSPTEHSAHAQRNAQSALSCMSVRSLAPCCPRRTAAAAAPSSASSSPRSCRRPPSPSSTPSRAGRLSGARPQPAAAPAMCAMLVTHCHARSAKLSRTTAQTSARATFPSATFPTLSGHTVSKTNSIQIEEVPGLLPSCDPGDGRRPPSHRSYRSYRRYRS